MLLHRLLIYFPGWSLGEHQEWSKFSNFEVATRVPFIISNWKSQSENPPQENNSVLRELNKSKSLYRNSKLHMSATASQNSVESSGYELIINEKVPPGAWSKAHLRSHIHKDYESYNGLVELVDLFPTLVDLSGLPSIPTCPEDSKDMEVCTEGNSLAPILNAISASASYPMFRRVDVGRQVSKLPFQHKVASVQSLDKLRIKKAAFSQYPRPGPKPTVHPDSDQPPTRDTTIMGYSIRTNRYRYTAWLKFDNVTFKPNWNKIIAEELYDHKVDAEENHNVCRKKLYKCKKKHLYQALKNGWRDAVTVY